MFRFPVLLRFLYQLNQLVLSVVIARNLPLSLAGEYLFYSQMALLISSIFISSTTLNINRNYVVNEKPPAKEDPRVLLKQIIITLLVMTCILCIGIFYRYDSGLIFVFASFLLVSTFLLGVESNYNLSTGRYLVGISIRDIVPSFLLLLLMLVVIVPNGENVTLLFLISLLTLSYAIVLFVYILRFKGIFKWFWHVQKKHDNDPGMLLLILVGLQLLTSRIDLIVSDYYLSPEKIAKYIIGFQIAASASFVEKAMAGTIMSQVRFLLDNSPSKIKLLDRQYRLYSFINGISIFCLLYFFGHHIILWLYGVEYLESLVVALVISGGATIVSLFGITDFIFKAQASMKANFMGVVILGLSYFMFITIFIEAFGLSGAAAGYVVSIIMYIVYARMINMKFSRRRGV